MQGPCLFVTDGSYCVWWVEKRRRPEEKQEGREGAGQEGDLDLL